jgi:hypothetical protein
MQLYSYKAFFNSLKSASDDYVLHAPLLATAEFVYINDFLVLTRPAQTQFLAWQPIKASPQH